MIAYRRLHAYLKVFDMTNLLDYTVKLLNLPVFVMNFKMIQSLYQIEPSVISGKSSIKIITDLELKSCQVLLSFCHMRQKKPKPNTSHEPQALI